ncbi:AAA domain-containing protein [Microcoleus sp. MON1_C5]|uniref:AAA domain-containing protein n=1 Tax=Microcoleus sp. MON1_C5 TaxID=2818828 RepID=UPI002FCF879F
MSNFVKDGAKRSRYAAVERVREGWIRRLIDLSRRNNLLYYRELKRGTLDFSDCNSKALKELLTGKTVPLIRLLPQAEELKAAAQVQGIRRRALANLEEKGLETLFLALGMATWTPTDGGRPPEAAVLLVPIHVDARGAIKLKRSGELQVNPVLLHALETEYGCQVTPECLLGEAESVGEDESPDLEAVYSELTKAASEVQGFEIKTRAVLSNFSFQKMAMVRDLRDRLSEMVANDMISAIAGDITARQNIRGTSQNIDVRELDRISPDKEFLVFDADSSQQQVIHAVLAGRNGVIQGPPGTGKSQTIANLIATLAASGQRILFVAEKRAALEVVKTRLEQKGLGHLLLDLHGAAISRREVLQQVAESLTLVRNISPADTGNLHQRFVDRRKRLNDHVARLHDKRKPSDKSIYEIQAELLLQFSESERINIRFRGVELNRLSAEKADTVEQLLAEISSGELTSLFLGDHPSPWMKVKLLSGNAALLASDVVRKIARDRLPAFYECLETLIFTTKLEPPTNLNEAEQLITLIEDVEKTLFLYSEDIFKQDLEKQVNALSPLRNGFIAENLAWLFDSNFKKAISTLKKLRKAGETSNGQLFQEVTKASEQLSRWRWLSRSASVPCQVTSLSAARDNLKVLLTDLNRIEPDLGQGNLSQLPLQNLKELFNELAADLNIPLLVARLKEIEREIEHCGASSIIAEFRRLKSDPSLWSKQFKYAWFASCLDQARAQDSALTVFNRETHEQLIEEFRALDQERVKISSNRVRRAHAERVIAAMNAYPEQEALVRREAAKKARHLPLRKLLAEAPDVLTSISPCWMASPLSVSQLLDADRRYFDVVIFDEASQVLPEDAVPALLRAERAVVAGDKYQLPPTTFFAGGLDEEEEAESPSPVEGLESLLDLMSSFLETWELLWHYRSRDEALIAFSNRHIYNDRLITFPSSGGSPSISHVLVSCIPGQEGQEESASREVQRVVELVIQHATEQPNETLGVITMGIKHAQRIEAALDAALGERPELAAFFDEGRPERFFVKNLERVQGDERDAILLSVGYGKDRSGRLVYRFGPLLTKGGERRLNVAVTRARQRMTLVSSFDHHDMDPNRSSSRGVELLRLYIQYAASEGKILGETEQSGVPLNPFEKDIYDALTGKGISLLPQWGVSSYRIDMVAQHPQQAGRFVLAIECDGASYHSLGTARDRDRLRQQQLEALGWRFHRIWSTDWFLRRDKEIQRAVDAYEAAVKYANQVDAQKNKPTKPVPQTAQPCTSQSLTPEINSPTALRGTRPNVPKRSKIDDYTQTELMSLIRWILSDGCLRTDEEILKVMLPELGFKRRGARIDQAVFAAIERLRSSR